MKRYYIVLRHLSMLMFALSPCLTHTTGGTQSSAPETVRYSGTIETRNGHKFAITGIKLGRDEASASTGGLSLVLAPKNRPEPRLIQSRHDLTKGKKEYPLTEDPSNMTKRSFTIGEMKTITVIEPDTIWAYKRPDGSLTYEYSEIKVVYEDSNGSEHTDNFLIEIGVRGTRTPPKIFFIRIPEKTRKEQRKAGKRMLACPDIQRIGHGTWSTPLADVIKLTIDGPCLKQPEGIKPTEPLSPAAGG